MLRSLPAKAGMWNGTGFALCFASLIHNIRIGLFAVRD